MSEFSRIVSANYLDRKGKSGGRWLMREVGKEPTESVAVTSIVATGVAFRSSSDHEEGFGCSTVAYCHSAETGQEHSKEGVRLSFDPYLGFMDPQGAIVTSCEKLTLNPDGSMYAILPAAPMWMSTISGKPISRSKLMALAFFVSILILLLVLI